MTKPQMMQACPVKVCGMRLDCWCGDVHEYSKSFCGERSCGKLGWKPCQPIPVKKGKKRWSYSINDSDKGNGYKIFALRCNDKIVGIAYSESKAREICKRMNQGQSTKEATT